MKAILAATLIFLTGALAGASLVALAGTSSMASAQGAPRMSARVLLNTVSEELRGKRTNVRLNLDSWEPGSETGSHQHPGPALLYVLEGELEETSAAGPRTLRAGEAVWNRGKLQHNVKNRAARPARALAFHLDPGR
jgi:quercetin dioxygenase-like cupin family protein